MTSFCSLSFKNSPRHSQSFLLNYYLYPDEFQISICSPNLALEPQIWYPTTYLTPPLECPNLTHLNLNSLYSLPTFTPPHPLVFLISREWEIKLFILDSSSSIPHIQSGTVFPIKCPKTLLRSSNSFQPQYIILVQSTINTHFESTFMFKCSSLHSVSSYYLLS